MPQVDFFSITQWWFLFLVLGGIFFPFTNILFRQFLDRGYIFAKIIAVLIVSYLVFIIATLRLLPFEPFTIWGVGLLLLVGNFVLLVREKKALLFPKTTIFLILLEEVLFFVCLLGWSYIRAHEPSIHGLEKFMDFGFVNTALRSDFLPVKDMWYTPQAINYYYFGHFVTAVLTKLSLIDSAITYNLMLATLFAFGFTGSFSLGVNLFANSNSQKVNLVKIIGCGIVAGFLVVLAGNLHTIYAFYGAYDTENPAPFWQLDPACKQVDNCFSLTPQIASFPNAYWYPNATRFIPYTIHEFPLYSFVVSDLHGHVIDIPFVLLVIAVLYAVVMQIYKNPTPHTQTSSFIEYFKLLSSWQKSIQFFVLLGLLIAVLYMTNASDGLVYLLLTGVVLLVGNFIQTKNKIDLLNKTLLQSLVVFACFLLLTLPFSVFFKPFVSGIGILCAPDVLTNIGKLGPFLFEKDHCTHSPLYMLMLLWGFFLFFALSLGVFLYRKRKQNALRVGDVFCVILVGVSFLLIAFPEVAYIKDIYPMHYRANTMFKFGYQAFMMLGIVSAYTMFRLSKSVSFWGLSVGQKVGYLVYTIVAFLLLFLVGIYPYFAIPSFYGNLKTYQGLDGLSYLEALFPDDLAAIRWMRESVKGQPVIVEAVGDSYTDYARFSAHTGLPTIAGWPVHEWLWRGSYEVVAPRVREVQTIYESTDEKEVKKLLDKYQAKYIVVGDLERQKYPTLTEEVFDQIGTIVFEKGTTKVYLLD